MAIQLEKVSQFNVGLVVRNAVEAVRTVRAQEQSRKESAFQEAVANGLDYEGQVEFRKKQLEDEASNGFADPEYKNKLEESLATTKRLKRFSDYRLKYQEALGELNSGHTNAVDYAKTLKQLLDGTDDPDLRSEIQTNLTSAETMVSTYKNTVLANQVKLAEFDGTEKTINSVLKKVEKAKALASINGNEDEVEQYALTIASLKSQKVQAKAEDMVNQIAVTGMLGANNSTSKLKTLNAQINDSDTETPVTINGKRFASEQQYWEITRNAYLSGAGSGVFTDYFADLETQYKQKIDGETARYGFVQPATIQAINNDLTTLRAQPEMAPFIDRIDGFRATAVADAVSTVAKTVIERAQYSGDFTQADTTLKGLGNTYQVDTTGYQLQLGTILNQQVNASIAAGQGTPPEASLLPGEDFAVPSVNTSLVPPPPSAAPNPAVPPPVTSTRGDYSVVAGDNLSSVAARNGLSLNQLLDLNPEYRANPNAVSVGAKIKLAAPLATTPPPVVVPVASPVSNTPPAKAPAPAPTMPTPTKPKTYSKLATPTDAQRKQVEGAKLAISKLQLQVEEMNRRNGITTPTKTP